MIIFTGFSNHCLPESANMIDADGQCLKQTYHPDMFFKLGTSIIRTDVSYPLGAGGPRTTLEYYEGHIINIDKNTISDAIKSTVGAKMYIGARVRSGYYNSWNIGLVSDTSLAINVSVPVTQDNLYFEIELEILAEGKISVTYYQQGTALSTHVLNIDTFSAYFMCYIVRGVTVKDMYVAVDMPDDSRKTGLLNDISVVNYTPSRDSDVSNWFLANPHSTLSTSTDIIACLKSIYQVNVVEASKPNKGFSYRTQNHYVGEKPLPAMADGVFAYTGNGEGFYSELSTDQIPDTETRSIVAVSAGTLNCPNSFNISDLVINLTNDGHDLTVDVKTVKNRTTSYYNNNLSISSYAETKNDSTALDKNYINSLKIKVSAVDIDVDEIVA